MCGRICLSVISLFVMQLQTIKSIFLTQYRINSIVFRISTNAWMYLSIENRCFLSTANVLRYRRSPQYFEGQIINMINLPYRGTTWGSLITSDTQAWSIDYERDENLIQKIVFLLNFSGFRQNIFAKHRCFIFLLYFSWISGIGIIKKDIDR